MEETCVTLLRRLLPASSLLLTCRFVIAKLLDLDFIVRANRDHFTGDLRFNTNVDTVLVIILISSDLPELMPMSDRILIMREGRQMDIVDGDSATQEEILAQAMGQAEPVPTTRLGPGA